MPNTHLRKQPQKGFRRGGKTAYHGAKTKTFAPSSGRNEATSNDEKWERTKLAHSIDENMGFARYDAGRRREGWLVNVQSTAIEDERVAGGGRPRTSTSTSRIGESDRPRCLVGSGKLRHQLRTEWTRAGSQLMLR